MMRYYICDWGGDPNSTIKIDIVLSFHGAVSYGV